MRWEPMPHEKSHPAIKSSPRSFRVERGVSHLSLNPLKIAGSSSLPVKNDRGDAAFSAARSIDPRSGNSSPWPVSRTTSDLFHVRSSGTWPTTILPVDISQLVQTRYHCLLR